MTTGIPLTLPPTRRDRRALVTGSTSGIGYAIAYRLRAAGYIVTIHGRDRDRVENARSALGATSTLVGDLANSGDVELLSEWIHHHPIDVLVNNAADMDAGRHQLVDTSRREYERLMTVNAWAGMELARAALPSMLSRDDHGRIIWMSSEGAVQPQAAHRAGPYLVSKHAVLALSRLFAVEAAGTTVTSNALLVGPTLTERVTALVETVMPGADPNEAVARMYPGLIAGRPALPEEVAEMVAYLASERSSATRGAVLRVDGGAVPVVGV